MLMFAKMWISKFFVLDVLANNHKVVFLCPFQKFLVIKIIKLLRVLRKISTLV
jgi:hypothetical protein